MDIRQFNARLACCDRLDPATVARCAVASLSAEEVYVQIGTQGGAVLVSALSENAEVAAYVADDFDRLPDADAALAELADTVTAAGLDDRLTFCAQSWDEFFLDLHHLAPDTRIGALSVLSRDASSSDYRSQLLSLLFARPLLSSSAALILHTQQPIMTRQAIADFLSSHPQARLVELAESDRLYLLDWDDRQAESDWQAVTELRQASAIAQLSQPDLTAETTAIPDVSAQFQAAVADYERGNWDAAERGYRAVLEREPTHLAAWFNLGMLYYVSENDKDALAALDRCLELDDTQANVHYGLGLVWARLEQTERAIAAYKQAIALAPNFLDAYNNLGNLYYYESDYDRAEAVYRQALKLDPSHFGSLLNLGNVAMMRGNARDALTQYERAQPLAPDDDRLQYNLNIAQIRVQLDLPVLYNTVEEVGRYRRQFAAALQDLIDRTDISRPETRQSVFYGVGWHVNFFLAYQGRNDLKFQVQYGDFLHDLLCATYPQLMQRRSMPKLAPGEKIRIGYVSYFFQSSSVSKLCTGWLRHANRDRFELFVYHLSDRDDSTTDEVRAHSDFYRKLPYESVAEIADLILGDRLHVLMFVDLGMFAKAMLLGVMRLAPVQCTSWCHPVTSGLPSIDYFLSSALMEPEDGYEHYRERLVTLPNIGVSYRKPKLPPLPKTRADFGLSEEATLYLSCQSLYKYLPQYDFIFAEIARRLLDTDAPPPQFAFLQHDSPEVTQQFRRRLQRAFAEVGLESDRYVNILPRQHQVEYWNLNAVADIFLDTWNWSGGVTTLEAIACGLPVVTCPGDFMRGRHAYAILTMLGVTDTIAENAENYIEIAVKLGRDRPWRGAIVAQMRERHDRLYDDTDCVRGLEDFYERVVAERLASGSAIAPAQTALSEGETVG